MDDWVLAVGSVVVGLLSGVVGAALIRRIFLTGREQSPEANDAARAAGIFVFLFFAVLGVIVAVGFTNRDTLEPIPADAVAYSPRVLAAGLIFIVGRALALTAAGYVNRASSQVSTRSRIQLGNLVRTLITAAAIVLSISQLGIDTTSLHIVTAAVVFGLAAAFALLVGLGGRSMGSELAAGRYLARMLQLGDELVVEDVAGTVVALHPASVEVETVDGLRVHLPNTRVFDGSPQVRRHPVRGL